MLQNKDIKIGKDILELLTSSMYLDPLTVFREYVQNAADSIDLAVKSDKLSSLSEAKIEIKFDHPNRSVLVRDNGNGLNQKELVTRMTSFGESEKRGTTARGFRGVGRLAGIGYCQKLIFRSQNCKNAQVYEVIWDCVKLKQLLMDQSFRGDLQEIVSEIVSIVAVENSDFPDRFFEVEMLSPRRILKDPFMNEIEISSYLSQVGPCPFDPNFNFGSKIKTKLNEKGYEIPEYKIYVGDSAVPLYRPFKNEIVYSETRSSELHDFVEINIDSLNGELAAIGWLIHHEYQGAIPNGLGIRGLRARTGNIQVGNESIFSDVFPEERFATWCVGEVYVLDNKIIPNGRRDHFEINNHFSNLKSKLFPVGSIVAKKCRIFSKIRNQKKAFDLHEDKTSILLGIVEQGTLSISASQSYQKTIVSHLKELNKISLMEIFDTKTKLSLGKRYNILHEKLENSLKTLSQLKIENDDEMQIYAKIIDLIYECSTDKAKAKILIDNILEKLE